MFLSVRLEREILRRVFGPVYENGEWRILHNEEVYELYRDDDILKFIELGNLRGMTCFHDFHPDSPKKLWKRD